MNSRNRFAQKVNETKFATKYKKCLLDEALQRSDLNGVQLVKENSVKHKQIQKQGFIAWLCGIRGYFSFWLIMQPMPYACSLLRCCRRCDMVLVVTWLMPIELFTHMSYICQVRVYLFVAGPDMAVA